MLLIKKLLLFSPCRLSVRRMGTKNKLASLAGKQEKPYIDARVPALLNRCVQASAIIAFCLIVFVKSGAKIQNFPQTISFPLEKLTNRHEKGAESRADILGLGSPPLRFSTLFILQPLDFLRRQAGDLSNVLDGVTFGLHAAG